MGRRAEAVGPVLYSSYFLVKWKAKPPKILFGSQRNREDGQIVLTHKNQRSRGQGNRKYRSFKSSCKCAKGCRLVLDLRAQKDFFVGFPTE